jgi:hypothetical protein
MMNSHFFSKTRKGFSTRAILWFIGLGMVGAAAETTHAQTYNARDEFALSQGGTTGVWSYGYTNGPTSNAFSLHTQTSVAGTCGAPLNYWHPRGRQHRTVSRRECRVCLRL